MLQMIKRSIGNSPNSKHAALPQLVGGGSKLSVGFIIGLIAVILVTIFMYHTVGI